MTDSNSLYRYRMEFTGDAVEAVMAPVEQPAADYWIRQSGEKLFNQTFSLSDDETDPDVPEEHRLPHWRDIQNGNYLEGFELHNGILEVFDGNGNQVYEAGMGEDDFWDQHVEEVVEYTQDNGLRIEGPVYLGFVSYTGTGSIDLELPQKFDPALLYVHVVQLPETVRFISKLIYNGEDLTDVSASGRYRNECAALYDGDKGPTLYHAETAQQ